MQALFIILNDIYLINEIHELLSKYKVGATTFESSGLGDVMMNYEEAKNTSTSLKKLMSEVKPTNKTIISVIKSEETLGELTKEIMEILDGIKAPGVGFMFTVPVSHIYGYKG